MATQMSTRRKMKRKMSSASKIKMEQTKSRHVQHGSLTRSYHPRCSISGCYAGALAHALLSSISDPRNEGPPAKRVRRLEPCHPPSKPPSPLFHFDSFLRCWCHAMFGLPGRASDGSTLLQIAVCTHEAKWPPILLNGARVLPRRLVSSSLPVHYEFRR